MANFKVEFTYPRSEEYEYITRLERIDLDKERKKDIASGNGFIIGPPNGVKKDLKDPNGIFSNKYGQTLKDLNPYADRYKCECGNLKSRINEGIMCPICKTKVKYIDDNLHYFGWKVLKDPHWIIHPNLFKSIEKFIGKDTLNNILEYNVMKDADGYIIGEVNNEAHPNEPFFGIGMMDFKDRFDEIIEYYHKASINNQIKNGYYDDILKYRHIIFAQSIPVFTTLLRPVNDDDTNLYFEKTNSLFMLINKLASSLNEYSKLKINQKSSDKQLLYDLQMKLNLLYTEIEGILQKKKGAIRSLLGGRYNFSARAVISPSPHLRIDQISLPYACLIELLQQRIINILTKTYGYNPTDAYTVWYKATLKKDPIIADIIEEIIKSDSNGKGIACILNRNPTIAYGGILQMHCVEMTDAYIIGTPLQILPLLAADFDENRAS